MKKDREQLKVQIDIKGSILLAVTITSFLLAITLLQSTSVNDEKDVNNIDNMVFSIISFQLLEQYLPFHNNWNNFTYLIYLR